VTFLIIAPYKYSYLLTYSTYRIVLYGDLSNIGTVGCTNHS